MSTDQMAMQFTARQEERNRPRSEDRRPGAAWLGLAIDHRALFDALQDDWLRPPDGAPGRTLGIRAFTGHDKEKVNGHRILVRIKLDPARLPPVSIHRRRAGAWVVSSLEAATAEDDAVFWPGPLPTFAISEILVETDEERVRLSTMTRQVSNVSLPVAPRVLLRGEDVYITEAPAPSESLPAIGLPPEMNCVRGALAMALWAVPRVDPWLDLLCGSLGDATVNRPSNPADYLGVRWWNLPPWLRSDGNPRESIQERLWASSVRVFRAAHSSSSMATELVERIVVETRNGGLTEPSVLNEWARETVRILRGDARIRLDDWKAWPVGKAIQLALVRPDPSTFRKWGDDLPNLPPAIWWTGAALCGLIHGYRRLPSTFRGDPVQQRLLAIYALRLFDTAPVIADWLTELRDGPKWHRHAGEIVLSWGNTELARKPEHARGKWFSSNLEDPVIRRSGEDIALSNKWPCLGTFVVVIDADIPCLGGSLELAGTPQRLVVKGRTEIEFPLSVEIQRKLDVPEFLRCVATEGASVTPPPDLQRRVVVPTREEILDRVRKEIPGRVREEIPARTPEEVTGRAPEEIPGLIYVPNFLSQVQEADIVAAVEKAEWSRDLKRRVQHYGWRYDYKSKEIDASMRLGRLPDWAQDLALRLKKEALLPHFADQVIVNEYVGAQGISKHVDCVPCFDDGIAMISLLESWEMVFREEGKAGRKVAKLLERGSVAIMTRDVRYRWSHEIPSRSKEPSGLKRGRRISVTFRKVNEESIRAPKRNRKK